MHRFHCEKCNKSYTSKTILRKHVLSHQEDKSIEQNSSQKCLSNKVYKKSEKQLKVSKRLKKGKWIVRLERLKASDFIRFPGISLTN